MIYCWRTLWPKHPVTICSGATFICSIEAYFLREPSSWLEVEEPSWNRKNARSYLEVFISLVLLLQVTLVRSIIIPHRSLAIFRWTGYCEPIAFLAFYRYFLSMWRLPLQWFMPVLLCICSTWLKLIHCQTLFPYRSTGCSHHTYLSCHEMASLSGKNGHLGSSFMFFSAPALHVTDFVMQLRWIQVGRSVDDRNWPISVCMYDLKVF